MKVPRVSIIVPTYNRSTYIVRAIRSIQPQSFSDFEIIVVDDNSTDDTRKVVAELSSADPRIHRIKHTVNKGSQAARNSGIAAAQGEWIAFLDSDDEWLPRSLELRLMEAERRGVKVVHSDCYIEYAASHTRVLFGIKPLSGMVYKEILKAPGPVFPTMLLHASTLKEIGDLDESIVSYQEWDTFIRLAKIYEFGFVKEPTFIYHRHTDETISASPLRVARGYEQVVRKHSTDMYKQLGPKGLAHHYIKIAAYYFPSRQYSNVFRYLTLALRNYLLFKGVASPLR